MTRAVLLSAAALALAGGAFFVFVWDYSGATDDPTRIGISTTQQVRISGTLPSELANIPKAGVGAGSGVFVQTKDPKTGRLTHEFRADRYEPQRDGVVLVDLPTARFYLSNGNCITLEAKRGRVVMPESNGDPFARGQDSTPTRGEMHDVIVKMRPSLGEAATMTIRLDNVAFDATTFRISTRDSLIDGKAVLAEDIPVELDAQDYSLRGTGLDVRWNEVASRLESLEIKRGGTLTIHNPSKFTSRETAAAPAVQQLSWRPISLVSMLQVTPPATAKHAERELYTATFKHNVVIQQNGHELGSGEDLLVGFAMSRTLGTAPASQPSKPKNTRNREKLAKTPASSKPTVADEGPITITWNGPMTIIPGAAAVRPQADGSGEIVLLRGSPAKVSRDGASASAAELAVATDGSWFRARRSERVPMVEFRSDDGSRLTTREIEYDAGTDLATLSGGGSATLIRSSSATQPADHEPMQIDFTKQAEVRLTTIGDQKAITRLELHGDVRTVSKGQTLRAENLGLQFSPAAASTQPAGEGSFAASAIERLVADGAVKLTLEGDTPATLEADLLRIGLTQEGEQIDPNSVRAAGNVRLTTPQQILRAGELTAQLNAAALRDKAQSDSLAAITSLEAKDNVHLSTSDGVDASAQRLERLPGESVLRLIGSPAKITRESSTLQGERIALDPQTQAITVETAGQITSVATEPNQPLNTFTLSWSKTLTSDPLTRQLDIQGDVHAAAAAPDGTAFDVRSQSARVLFAAAPATAPASTQPAFASLGKIDQITFNTAAVLEHVTSDAGKPQQAMRLESESLVMRPELQRFEVPQSGRALLTDYRPASDQPADVQSGPLPQVAGGPGNTAIRWMEFLVVDMKNNTIVVQGQVRVARESITDDGQPQKILWRLETDQLSADLEPSKQNVSPNLAGDAMASLRKGRAQGNVAFSSDKLTFSAALLEFDAASGIAIADGLPSEPVELTNDNGRGSVKFKQVRWNWKTGQIEKLTKVRGNSR